MVETDDESFETKISRGITPSMFDKILACQNITVRKKNRLSVSSPSLERNEFQFISENNKIQEKGKDDVHLNSDKNKKYFSIKTEISMNETIEDDIKENIGSHLISKNSDVKMTRNDTFHRYLNCSSSVQSNEHVEDENDYTSKNKHSQYTVYSKKRTADNVPKETYGYRLSHKNNELERNSEHNIDLNCPLSVQPTTHLEDETKNISKDEKSCTIKVKGGRKRKLNYDNVDESDFKFIPKSTEVKKIKKDETSENLCFPSIVQPNKYLGNRIDSNCENKNTYQKMVNSVKGRKFEDKKTNVDLYPSIDSFDNVHASNKSLSNLKLDKEKDKDNKKFEIFKSYIIENFLEDIIECKDEKALRECCKKLYEYSKSNY
uniref:BESS domain-containing protein n=1 Tax=Strongyloides stercoralis TaxID=6248 RepID=A0A0K0DSY0_STRER